MTFPLDLVRESVESDVTSFLGGIEERARALAELPLDWPAGAALEAIGVNCHGIAGTTSLVGLTTMSTSARLLERLAEVGRNLAIELELMAARTRDLGSLYLDGVMAMRAMLAHELAGDPAAARRLASDLHERIEVAQAGDLRAGLGEPAPAAEGPVDDGWDAPAPAAPALVAPEAAPEPAIPPELLDVFRDEARDAQAAMRELVDAVYAAPGVATIEPIERLFHTLKGAAATVGLAQLAAGAKTLQLRLAAAVDGTEAIDDAFVGELIRDASLWFDQAGLGQRAAASGPPAEPPPALFHGEALDRLRELRRDLAGRAPDLTAAARTLHLLRGSALVVGASALAGELIEVERAVSRGEVPLAAIERLLATVERAAAKDGPTLARPAHDARGATPAVRRVTLDQAIEPELWDAFRQECQELLDGLDAGILALDGGDTTVLGALFRQYHTLKGSVNTIGLAALGEVVHDVEDVIEALGKSSSPRVDKSIVDGLLEAQRLIKRGLGQAAQGYLELDRAKLDRLLRRPGPRALSSEPSTADPGSYGPLDPSSPGSVDPASAGLGSAGPGSARSSAGPDSASGSGSSDVGRRYVRVPLDRLDELMNLAGELVIGRSRMIERTALLRGIQRELGVGRERLIDAVDRFSTEHEFVHLDGRRARPAAIAGTDGDFSPLELDRYEDIHILARSLTELSTDFREMDVELVRELQAFHEDADRIGAIVSTLQGEITRTRMVPVETLFARLRLPIREAAERERKEVRVVTVGDEVALDKSIADALFAPLLHLVRNAVGHGIERADLRGARGKPLTGTITLAARQQAGQIVLEIADDGGGLDRAALRAQGVARGLVQADTPLDDPAITELVFVSGLSTSARVDTVAGRGVGGSVVKRSVERMGGNLRVTSSGAGTTFTVTLPMTLSITRAVIAKVGDLQLAVPLSFAVRIRDAREAQVVESAGVRRLAEAGGFVPVTAVHQLLDVPAAGGATGYVVVRLGDDVRALEVDAVIGQEEIVVKPLGAVLDGHPLFAGVSFRGTGDLALVLDVPGVFDGTGGRGTDAGPAPSPERAARAAIVEPPTAGGAPDSIDTRAEPAAPTPPAAPVAPAPAPRAIRVLFVDDSVSVRKVAERTLRELGAEVTVASDGVDALDKLRAATFDLVFTDLEMPRMHGYDLLREIRFVPGLAQIPVVVVSSRSGTKHQDQARSLGATDYLTKPFSAESLGAALTRWGKRG